MKTKAKAGHVLKPLSRAKQAELEHFWNTRLADPLAFIPVEVKQKGLSPTEARKANQAFGKSASSYLKTVLDRITSKSDLKRRRKDRKKIVAVGYGHGHDAEWLSKAAKAGLQTKWVDVCGVPWSLWASTSLNKQFVAMPKVLRKNMEPQMITFEIQSLLAEPGIVGLDTKSVEVWYLSRLLNCLSTQSAKAVLQEIGRLTLSPRRNTSKRGAVIIINALSDQNPNSTDACCGRTSIRRSMRMITSNLALGAGCRVEPCFVKYYNYFGKLVTAMTIMAKE
jgi:hypothetical protein